MVAAVSALVWAIFGVMVTLSVALVVRMLWLLLRRLKEFRAAAGEATGKLNAAMTEVNELLRQATEGMTRVQSRRFRDR